MHNIDSPMLSGAIRYLCHKIFYGSPTWHIKDRNDYHQMEDNYSYKWGNKFIDKNKIKKKV